MNWIKAIFLRQECWVSGIYRITSYRAGEYLAFYIVDGQRNWGDFVSKPPDFGWEGKRCWLDLDAAKKACEDHAKEHTPAPSTIKRAQELLEEMELVP